MNAMFQVKPVSHYTAPRYPESDARVQLEPTQDHTSIWRRSAAMMQVVGVLFFLSACPHPSLQAPQPEVIVAHPVQPQVVIATPVQPQVVLVSQAQCAPGQLRCRDRNIYELCQNGVWVQRGCDDHCRETRGHDWISDGCLGRASEPCRCVPDPNYDMIDGGLGYVVEPNML